MVKLKESSQEEISNDDKKTTKKKTTKKKSSSKKVEKKSDDKSVEEKSSKLVKLRKEITSACGEGVFYSGLERSKLIMNRFSTGSFWLDYSCLGEGQIIVDAKTGEVHKIEDVIDNKIPVNVIPIKKNGEACSNYEQIIEWFDNGIKDVYKIYFDISQPVYVTNDHLFLSDLKLNFRNPLNFNNPIDVLNNNLNVIGCNFIPKTREYKIKDDYLKFLGLYLGDGGSSSSHGISIPGRKTRDTDEYIINLAKRLELNITKEIDKNDGYVNSFNLHDKIGGYRDWDGKIVSTNHMSNMLKYYKLFGLGPKEKFIPSQVFTCSKKQIGLFLSYLFITDGCVSSSKFNFTYVTSSFKKAYQIQYLLKCLGILSRVIVTKTGMYQTYFNGIDKFLIFEKYGFWLARFRSKVNYLKEDYRPGNGKSKYLKSKINNNFYKDKIVKVEKLGKKRVFDFKIDYDSHTYLLGDVFVHNCGGGAPKGRFIMAWGEESTLKTTIGYKVMADAQRRDRLTHEYLDLKLLDEKYDFDNDSQMYIPKEKGLKPIEPNVVGMVDLEGAHDDNWAKSNGVFTDRMYYATANYGEQAVDVIEELIRSELLDVILVDSVAMLTPIMEQEKSAEDSFVGRQALLMNRACRVWTLAMNGIKDHNKKPLVFMVNQRREKVGLVFGPNETRPGGKGQGFITSIEIRTRRGPVEYLDKDKKFPLIQELKGTINKNKTAPPKIDYSFNIAVNDYTPPINPDELSEEELSEISKEEYSAMKKAFKDKFYPIAFKKGDILEHKDVINYAHKYGMTGKFEEGENKGKFFIRLIGEDPHVYERKGDMLNDWFYLNIQNYSRVRHDLLLIMTGKV